MEDMKAMKTALANIKKLARDSLVQRYKKSKQKPAEVMPEESMEAESDLLEEEMTEDMGSGDEMEECDDELPSEIISLGGRKPAMKFEEEAPKPKNKGRFQKKLK